MERHLIVLWSGLNLELLKMAKTVKKKDTQSASNVFHSIMAASVKGNPKPKKKAIKKEK